MRSKQLLQPAYAQLQEQPRALDVTRRPLKEGALVPVFNRAGAVVAHAIVDEADFVVLGGMRWHLHVGYAATRRNLFMQHYVIGGVPEEGFTVDHINRDRLDNRRANLRVCTIAENSQNVPGRNRTSQFRGVYFQKGRGRWRAQVKVNGVAIHLGSFVSEAEAAEAAAAGRARLMPFSEEAR